MTMKINTQLIGERRKALNLTQKQLAERVNSSHGMISLIESGKSAPPLKKLPLYAKALGVTESELLVFSSN